mmetsp:Transcript_21482/g.25183  ORF Transcript_21482/g.25183 Transcript_21482/m.25183 type:complete len:83 (-) Transcript_21482:44-292(-)
MKRRSQDFIAAELPRLEPKLVPKDVYEYAGAAAAAAANKGLAESKSSNRVMSASRLAPIKKSRAASKYQLKTDFSKQRLQEM